MGRRFSVSSPGPSILQSRLRAGQRLARSLPWLLGLALPFLLGSAAYGSTIIGTHSGNGVASSAVATAGFRSLGGDDLVTSPTDSDVSDYTTSPGTSVTATAANTPMGGTGTAQGQATLNFTYGTALADDRFEFLFNATASALTAQNLPPTVPVAEDADALVTLVLRAEFRLDSGIGGAAPGDFLGFLNLGPLRPANLYETFSGSIADDSAIVGSLSPGGAPVAVSLFADHAYEIDITYEYLVPHGVDPTESLTVVGTVSPTAIPEPNTALLLVLGLTFLAVGSQPGRFSARAR